MAISRKQQLAETRLRMGNRFTPNQILGRTQTIGCVAVEITQKCNLDCNLCYLSEHSQSVKDIPIEEVYRRLDQTLAHYGAGTSVQITGGEPTLRKHGELVDIIRYASRLGLHPALFTNGIAASRSLLEKLAEAGLRDVAFHVDSTQGREGLADETALNRVRLEYIDRCRGLGLMVIFNTTIHGNNFTRIPELVNFFIAHADVVGFASFQLHANTGRGEWKIRDEIVQTATVKSQIEKGLGKTLPWDRIAIGHPHCHSYMPTLVTNGRAYAIVDDELLFGRFLDEFSHIHTKRQDGLKKVLTDYARALATKPRWLPIAARELARKIWDMKSDLIEAKGKVHKLSFFIQNFMDADQLEKDRVNACSFMVMTVDGPVSMCEHNARRDDYILNPIRIVKVSGEEEIYFPLKEVINRDPTFENTHLTK